MSGIDVTQRFLRPLDVERIRRNHRQVLGRKAMVILANLALFGLLAFAGVWLFRRTQQDRRFAVRDVRIVGAKHTPQVALAAIAQRYRGQNLFRLDLGALRQEVGALPWVARIDVEKKLPDVLVVHVIERIPVALVSNGGTLRYADEQGIAFAELSPATGDAELPIVSAKTREQIRRCVELLTELRRKDPELYASISEIHPILPDHFAVFDRRLGSVVYAEKETFSARWRALCRIVSSESYSRSAIEYADLRFSDRIVVKPRTPQAFEQVVRPILAPMAVTN